MADFKARYVITADNRQAKQAFQELDGIQKRSGSLTGDIFKGSLSANAAMEAARAFQQVAFAVKDVVTEMTNLAAERQNAFKGLESISNFYQINPAESQRAVKELRLVKAGIIEIGDASIALKNLLSSGFSLPEATKLLEAFSDTAAFGKSQALSFGEAIKGATEGIRNGNSVLVDNVGLTKNLTAILKDAGYEEKDLARAKEDTNVRQALYNGLLKETLPQMGDANKLTQGWTGNTAALTTAQNNLYAATGNVIINNRELNALMQHLTGTTNALADEIGKTGSKWNRTIDTMTTKFAEFVLSVEIGVAREIGDLAELVNMISLAGNAMGTLLTLGQSSYYGEQMFKDWDNIGSYNEKATRWEKRIRDDYNKRLGGNAAANNKALLDSIAPGTTLSDVINGRPGSATSLGGGSGKKSAAGNAMRKFFEEELGAVVTSFRRDGARTSTGGVSKHGTGEAIDIRTRDRSIADIFTITAKALEKGYRLYDERDTKKPHQHYEANSKRASSFLSAAMYGGEDQLAYLKSLDAERLGKQTGSGGLSDFIKENLEKEKRAAEEFASYAEQILADWIRDEQRASDERLAIRRAEADQAMVILDEQLDRGEITEREYLERVGQMRIDMLLEEQNELANQIQTRETQQRLLEVSVEIQTERLRKENSIEKSIRDQNRAYQDQIDQLRKVNQRPSGLRTRTPMDGLNPFEQGLFGPDGMDIIRTEAMELEQIYRDMGSMVSDVTGQMAQGVGSLIQAWVLYGDLGPNAVRKMVAAVLAGVAAEAAVKAIFQLAEGFAMLFINPGAAAAHFKAAALYGAVAVTAGVAGRLVAGNSFKEGGGSGSSPSSAGASRSSSASLTPISRQSETTFMSGRNPWQQANDRMAEVLERLEQKIKVMRPGDVIAAGATQNPEAIGNGFVNAVKRNASIGTSAKKMMG
jgi:hypothetical protein